MEPEKPVIPQFMAYYIEKWKYEGLIMHEWFTFDHDDEDEDKVSKYLYNNDVETNKRREFMLIDAIRYGYEVEKEKKYYVLDSHGKTILVKLFGKQIAPSQGRCVNDLGKQNTNYQFTEQEIKEYDERYLVFAEEVME